MKYFLVQSVMASPLPVSPEELKEKFIPLHEAHIAWGIEKGIVLFAGPKIGKSGGFMIARAESVDELQLFTDADPFVLNAIAGFDITEFLMNDRSEFVKDW
ncbi:MAG: hypothetical protein E7420_08545 [Ruminococcaceae bacterium]|nr:hypothetical protein [Oscillospiraceae bacterium]